MGEVTEIVYTWPSGREEVRYRRPKGSAGAKKLIDEVECLKARLAGQKCPYSYRDASSAGVTRSAGRPSADELMWQFRYWERRFYPTVKASHSNG